MEEESKNRLVKRRLLNEEVYDRIKEMIADNRFNPGTHINVEKLTHEFGVSRTPIWEAVRKLENEGILINVPHKGVKIRELSFKETKDLYEVRESLECRAASLGAIHVTDEILRKMEECLVEQYQVVKSLDDVAYSKSDDQFHGLVCDASQNGLLKEIVCQVRSKTLPLAFRITRNLEDFYNLHVQILEAFRKRDPAAAEEAMHRHFGKMAELIRKFEKSERTPAVVPEDDPRPQVHP